MIEVKHLTKKYGNHVAVEDLSFTIEEGVIYGFLGPNGAGKSTTMNIIAGCLGATEGEVLIGGYSIGNDPMQAKRQIGYLPEQPPLYADMTPFEYLYFVASAKHLPRAEKEKQIHDVMETVGIQQVRNRLIRNLSKGYRQRVGIAQALLGNPEIIILDEPTVGLDPAQIIEIRDLIRELGKNHTIILSSHILGEVQAVCDSIMIISRGRLVASDTPDNLTKLLAGTSTLSLEVKGTKEETERILGSIEKVECAEIVAGDNNHVFVKIRSEESSDIREAVFNAFSDAKTPLLEMKTEHASLEDVFLELTQEDIISVSAGLKRNKISENVLTSSSAKNAEE